MSTMAKRDRESIESPESSSTSRKRLRHVDNTLSDAVHKKLDSKINRLFTNFDVDDVEEAAHILAQIAEDCEQIDRLYTGIPACKVFLKNNPDAHDVLKIAHSNGSYRDIRNLDILQKRVEFVAPPRPFHELAVSHQASKLATERSWERPYVGDGAHALSEMLRLYLNTEITTLYSRSIPVLQSSGTGKSRTIDELSKTTFVIPINLRGKGTEGFPAPDSALREWLFHESDQKLEAQRMNAFLTALLIQTKVALDHIDKLFPDLKMATLAFKFRHFMTLGQGFDSQGHSRVRFYHEVVELADKLLSRVVPLTPSFANKQSPRVVFLKDVGNAAKNVIEVTLLQAAEELIEKIRDADGLQQQRDQSLLVIAFDEAHAITEDPKSGDDDILEWSKFSELRRALRALRSQPIFPIFLSTTGKIHQFSPAARDDWSTRIQRGILSPIPPFHEVGFDHLADRVPGDGSWTLDNVTDTKFIAKLGRPLFGSRFEYGDDTVKEHIIDFAAEKLLGTPYPTKEDTISQDGMLACLCVRLAIEFSATTYLARQKERVQVEKHMRICLVASPGFEGAVTVAASEPLLAEAAARLMKHEKFKVPQVLLEELQHPGLSKGDRGELIATTLLVLARDKAGSRAPPLLSFLRALFPVEVADKILSATPSTIRAEEEEKPLEETFAKSYVWFNHFIKVQEYGILNREYLWRLIVRGAAVLCANNQRGVDLIIPFLYLDKQLKKTNVSAIFVQVKNDAQFSNNPQRFLFDAMDPFLLGVFDRGEAPLPIIRMVFALAAKDPEVQVVGLPERSQPSRSAKKARSMSAYTAYDLWCCRASSETFAPIGEQEDNIYEALLKISRNFPDVYEEKDRPLAGMARRNMHPGTAVHAEHWSRFTIN